MCTSICLYRLKAALNRRADGGSKRRARGKQLNGVAGNRNAGGVCMQHEEQRQVIRIFYVLWHACELINQKAQQQPAHNGA